jgi:hypothetical protein
MKGSPVVLISVDRRRVGRDNSPYRRPRGRARRLCKVRVCYKGSRMLEGHGDDDDVANAYTARALRTRGSHGRRAGRGRVRRPLHEVRDGWAGAGLIRRSATGAAGTGTEAPAEVAVALRVPRVSRVPRLSLPRRPSPLRHGTSSSALPQLAWAHVKAS